MSQGFKKSGFQQGLYEINSTAKEMLGTLRMTRDGRKFRYARAGGTALLVGKMTSATANAAAVTNLALTNTYAVGAKLITQTISSATYGADYFRGGMFQINDGTGEGSQYPILSSTSVSSGTSITVEIEEGLKVALTAAACEVSLITNPWAYTVISATEEAFQTGVPPVAVTSEYYYWSQTGGLACILCESTAAVGSMVDASATDGAVDAINSTLDVDCPIIGIQVATGAAGEYKPIWLTID